MEQREVFEVQPHELLMGLADVIRETQKSIGYFEVKKLPKHISTKQLTKQSRERKKFLPKQR